MIVVLCLLVGVLVVFASITLGNLAGYTKSCGWNHPYYPFNWRVLLGPRAYFRWADRQAKLYR